MNTLHYLVAAFMAIWIILAIYLFSIHSRERKLRAEIDRLKKLVETQLGIRDSGFETRK